MKRIALLLAAIVFPAGVAFASVDVNTATKEELEAEGIGSTAAQALIDYRTKNGPFKSSDDVRRVINDAIATKLNIGISISGPASAKSAAPKETSADVTSAPPSGAKAPTPTAKAAPTPDAKSPGTTASSKPQEKPAARDDQKSDSIRDQKTKDQDDRKT